MDWFEKLFAGFGCLLVVGYFAFWAVILWAIVKLVMFLVSL